MNHRTPPKPEWYDSAEPGICRWCGCCIFHERGPDRGKPNFKRWHNRCVKEFQFIFWPAVTARELGKRRGWVCEDCGAVLQHGERYERDRYVYVKGPKAEHHHVIPLIDYQHDPADPYAAWREGNLALLCHTCHMRRHHPVKPIPEDRQRRLF